VSIATGVPALTADEAAHGAQVEARLRAEIARAGGWIGFARYMELVLYEPGLGYYSAGASKLGAAGDFVTAPELAPLFGRCLAVQCEEVLRTLGGGDLLELGAGSGAMAATLLAELARRDALPRRYRILDVSADLRERQHATIAAAVPGLADRVEWLDRPPGAFTGVIVANEVLDALPVERFVMRGGEVASLGVAARDGRLAWCEGPASERLVQAVRHIERDTGAAWPEGYVSEVNLALGPWLGAIAAALARGVMLFVDYGLPRREYYSPSAARARCSATSATVSTRIPSHDRGCRTSRPGWTSRPWPRRPWLRASTSRATPRRRTSCLAAASTASSPRRPGSASCRARSSRDRRCSSRFRARWASVSRSSRFRVRTEPACAGSRCAISVTRSRDPRIRTG
jgi:SAM-dependent MidA family methyltransferase